MSGINEIIVFPSGGDPSGREVADEAKHRLGIDADVGTARVYRFEGMSKEDVLRLAEDVLVDIHETFELNPDRAGREKSVVEVGLLPGVMDPAAGSVKKTAEDLGLNPSAVETATMYDLKGVPTEKIGAVITSLLVNPAVQRVVTKAPETLVFNAPPGPIEVVPIRDASVERLRELSRDTLFLDDHEMKTIQRYYKELGREPTDCELEIIAGAWSEHCGHKTFKAEVVENGEIREPLMTRIKDAARRQPLYDDLVVSAFKDNAGVIRFYEGHAIAGKVETHNSPSAIEPYGGAMTGSGGVFRDIMGTGKGAKTIISTDMFCFAPPDTTPESLPPGTIHPDHLKRKVVQGVRDYGNRMGIPTANGSVHYHPDFGPKPTIIVGAYGILPEALAEKGEPQEGDCVVIVGGRTGRDGIHGATFSSAEMTDRTMQVNSSAVQIGNAIEEKRMFDALLEARDEDCIRAITDCGAAGFSSAIGEIGADIGVTVDISKAPLKYEGLAPWEIWMSESQERMVLAVPPEKWDELQSICQKYNVEATNLGVFDGSKTLTVNYGDQNVAQLDYAFLEDGLPQRVMEAEWEKPEVDEVQPEYPASSEEWVARLKRVLSHGNVASKESIARQYDQGVQGGNIVPPYGGINQDGPNDALVVRPLLGKPYGVVQSHGMNPILNRLDPERGSKWAFAEGLSNYVAVGGDPNNAGAVNNFIWPKPDKKAMGSLSKSVDAVCHMMDLTGIPVISGKDSLSSTYTRRNSDGEVVEVIEIPPVLCMSFFGGIEDVERTMTSDIKRPGSKLYMLGRQGRGMGGSIYYDVASGSSGEVPEIDEDNFMPLLNAVHHAIKNGRILACHDVSEGGVATAVTEMCIGGNCGADIIAPEGELRADEALFNETAGCFVVEVGHDVRAEELFAGLPFAYLGYTKEEKTLSARPKFSSDYYFDVAVDELKQSWQAPEEEAFK